MGEVLVPADPVKLAISYLTDQGFPWSVTVTKNRPNPTTGRIVTVRRAGGAPVGLKVVDAPWLTVEAFADTDEDASDLAHHAWGLLFSMEGEVVDGVQCYTVRSIAGPADMPDADAQRPRYVMTAQVTFRASVYVASA